MKIMMNKTDNLSALMDWVDKIDKDHEVIFMYIKDEPMTAEAFGLKEGDGPVLFSEFEKRITTNVDRMKSYIKGRYVIEPTKG